MDIIQKQPLLNNQFDKSQSSFDLVKQNQLFGIIKFPVIYRSNDFDEVIRKIISRESLTYNYYEINCMLSQIESSDRSYVVNKIAYALTTILMAANNSVRKTNGTKTVTISEFNQIYKYYHDIGYELYGLLKVYQKNLVKPYCIPGGGISCILDSLERTIFFTEFIKISDTDIIQIENNMTHIDYHNVEQLIFYIRTIYQCMANNASSVISPAHRQKLVNVIKKCLDNVKTIDCLNAYLHDVMLANNNTKTLVNNTEEYSTVNVAKITRDLNRKKYSVLNIFMRYCHNKTILYLCYSKYFKIRILDSNYRNLESEISNIKTLANTFGKTNAQNLLNMVSDIMNSRKVTEIIHASTIKVTNSQYQNLPVIPSVVKPIILDNSMWNMSCNFNIDLNYPPELQMYLDIASKMFVTYTHSKHKVKWQGLFGTATFSAHLGNREVDIKCNILQAIALSYLNSNNRISVDKLAATSGMGTKLADKVISSLFETNLLISNTNDKSYIVNTNYTGDNTLDLVKAFKESFIEIDHKVED